MKRNPNEIITERIVAALEAGTIPWRKPWRTAGGLPMNLVSGNPYHGINVWMTIFQPYDSPYWLTFNQCRTRGGNVRKGEKGTPIIYYRLMDSKTETTKSGKPKQFPWLSHSTVFNVEQCDGLEYPKPIMIDHDPIPICESVVNEWDDKPTIEHGGGVASYSRRRDTVNMPKLGRFDNPEYYYSSLFHELAHATGHESRQSRDLSGCFGSTSYSLEELTAEMGSAMLCGHCGIDAKTLDNSAAYISTWLGRLKADPTLVVKAASKGQKAADMILGDKAMAPTKSDSDGDKAMTPTKSDSDVASNGSDKPVASCDCQPLTMFVPAG